MTSLLLISAAATAALGAVSAFTVKDDWQTFDRQTRAVGIAVTVALFGSSIISAVAAF